MHLRNYRADRPWYELASCISCFLTENSETNRLPQKQLIFKTAPSVEFRQHTDRFREALSPTYTRPYHKPHGEVSPPFFEPCNQFTSRQILLAFARVDWRQLFQITAEPSAYPCEICPSSDLSACKRVASIIKCSVCYSASPGSKATRLCRHWSCARKALLQQSS